MSDSLTTLEGEEPVWGLHCQSAGYSLWDRERGCIVTSLEAIARIRKLQEENRFLIGEWQRLQPGGSPPPGGVIVLVPWIRIETAKQIAALQERVRELEGQ